jgi:uncharacterized MAPEG superfamily protein
MSERDWREQRKRGMAAIAVSALAGAALWFALDRLLPPLAGMDDLAARMLVALKCCALAALFCLFGGVEAVAHERLQSAAFDPLAGHETTRLRVNKQYLQNTLEQFVLFAVGLFGLAAYSETGGEMRAVIATTVVWIAFRFAFWIGYHKSAAMRGLGAPGMIVALLMLLYVCARVGGDVAGNAGAIAVVGLFLILEAVLFWGTRGRPETAA